MPIDVEVKCTYKVQPIEAHGWCGDCGPNPHLVTIDVQENMGFAVRCLSCGSENVRTKLGFIYILVDPNTLRPRYVGRSVNPIERYRSHLTMRGPSAKRDWLKALLAQGQYPILHVVDIVTGDEAVSVEHSLIRRLLKEGEPLLNVITDQEPALRFRITHVAVNEDKEPLQ